MAEGRVTIKIDWDRRQLSSDLSRITRQINSSLQAELDVDTSQAQRQINQIAGENHEFRVTGVSNLDEIIRQAQSLDAGATVRITANSSDLDQVRRQVEDLDNTNINFDVVVDDTALQNISSPAGGAIAGGAMAGGAIGAVGVGVAGVAGVAAGIATAVDATTNFTQAQNKLQTQTGATAEEMEIFSQNIENVYTNNFGENLTEVADTMANVHNQTGLVDTELEKATEYAFLLSDTFGVEVEQGIRGSSALMKQFGIDAETAYNLMAQGAQNGLNQNDDLADQISEYATYYSDMGLSAEDMFNMMANGAEQGVYQIDYLNDAIKEFGIRTKDNSNATADAFTSLGLDVTSMSQAFAKGGEKSANAFKDTVSALAAIEDPVKRNEIGVALFGTKFEDLGEDAIFALTNINGEISNTQNTLEDLNNIRYDDLSAGLEGLGREIEFSVLLPLGEQLIPIMETAIEAVGGLIEEIDFDTIGDFLGSSIGNALETGTQLAPIFEQLFTALSPVVTSLLPVIQTLITSIFNILLQLIGPLAQIIQTILPPLLSIIQMLAPVIEKIVSKLLPPILDLINRLLQPIMTLITGLLPPLLALIDPILDMVVKLLDPLTRIIGAILPPILDIATKLLVPLAELLGGLLTPLLDLLWLILEPLLELINLVLPVLIEIIDGRLSIVFDSLLGIIKAVIGILGGLIDFITGVFTGNWGQAWQGIQTIFGSVFDGLFALAKAPINLIIGLINGLTSAINIAIDGLNSLSINVPDWVPGLGGSTWGVSIPSIPKIPYLAKGGVVNRATQAVIGEDGAEAVIPLEKNTQGIKMIADQISSQISTGQDIIIHLSTYLDSNVVYKQIIKANNKNTQRTGKNALAT